MKPARPEIRNGEPDAEASPGPREKDLGDLPDLRRKREGLREQMREIDQRIEVLEALQPVMREAQRDEITEHEIYRRLAEMTDNPDHRDVLRRLAEDERTHYQLLEKRTGREIRPRRWRVWMFVGLARMLGFRFTLRLMESREEVAQKNYRKIREALPGADDIRRIERDEFGHEDELIDAIDETKLRYASSVVLGLNDALVELTGAIAGYTLALQHTRIIAVISLLTGISASLSMAGSEYLSIRTDEKSVKSPARASVYTGVAYIFATLLLVLPFFIIPHHLAALGWTLGNALLLIFLFTYYISFAKGQPFKRRFLEMVLISWGVAAISFGIGYLARRYFNLEI
jgi:VIT1/CCC1 family predicted Fe2+/Mn2+ transporter